MTMMSIRSRTSPAGDPSSPPARILLVEPDEVLSRLTRLTLEDCGYSVVEARSGRDALHTAQRETFDLLIADLSIPDFDPCGLARQLERSASATYVLYLTTHPGRLSELRECAPSDSRRLLEKPFGVTELSSAVRRTLLSLPAEQSDFRHERQSQ